jgi:peptide/nickel transport system substrate-binding protein
MLLSEQNLHKEVFMRNRAILFSTLAIVLVLVLFFTGCSSATTSTTTTASTTTKTTATTTTSSTTATTNTATSTPTTSVTTSAVQTGGLLTMISPNAPTSWGYPVKAGAGFAPIFASLPTTEGFIDADLHGTILPKLALSWDIPADKSSITFHLRQGVKFHDGTAFDADAAKWNLDLFQVRGTGSPADWKSVEVVDKYTVRINLKVFKNTQLSNFTYGMVSPTAVKSNGTDWAATNPVGTGPFKFKKFVANTSLEFERFDDYWNGKANVDGIKYIYIVDATTASMAYQAGDALVWEGADAKSAYQLSQKGYQRLTRRGPIMNLIPDSINADSPFAKLAVRQAVEYAIDRKAIVDAYGYGLWETVFQPNVPEQFGYVSDLIKRDYNPAKAKELLAQAGYPNGFETTIITSSALAQDPLVAIQDNLAAVNIKVKIDVQSASKWAETRTTGWHNGLFYVTHGATDYNYCAFLERYLLPTSGYAGKSIGYPEGWVSQITNMMLSSNPTDMANLAMNAVRMEVDNVLEIPLWVQAEVYVAAKNVHDMGIGTHGDGFSWNTAKVWISK